MPERFLVMELEVSQIGTRVGSVASCCVVLCYVLQVVMGYMYLKNKKK